MKVNGEDSKTRQKRVIKVVHMAIDLQGRRHIELNTNENEAVSGRLSLYFCSLQTRFHFCQQQKIYMVLI